MFTFQAAYYLNISGIISAFLLQCRPFVVSYLSNHVSLIDEAFKIRKTYANETLASSMLFIAILELLSLAQIYINIYYPFLCSLLTGGLSTIFMLHELSIDIIINFYTYSMTSSQRHNELIGIKINRYHDNDSQANKVKKYINTKYNINDIQLEEWDKVKNLKIYEEWNKLNEMLASNENIKTKKWKKCKNIMHIKNSNTNNNLIYID